MLSRPSSSFCLLWFVFRTPRCLLLRVRVFLPRCSSSSCVPRLFCSLLVSSLPTRSPSWLFDPWGLSGLTSSCRLRPLRRRCFSSGRVVSSSVPADLRSALSSLGFWGMRLCRLVCLPYRRPSHEVLLGGLWFRTLFALRLRCALVASSRSALLPVLSLVCLLVWHPRSPRRCPASPASRALCRPPSRTLSLPSYACVWGAWCLTLAAG